MALGKRELAAYRLAAFSRSSGGHDRPLRVRSHFLELSKLSGSGRDWTRHHSHDAGAEGEGRLRSMPMTRVRGLGADWGLRALPPLLPALPRAG